MIYDVNHHYCDCCGAYKETTVTPVVLGPRKPKGWLELVLEEAYAPLIRKQLELDTRTINYVQKIRRSEL